MRVGADAGTGETVVLRLYGEVVDHAQSVVLPLLLPDAPVVVWWPVNAPPDPANDPLGALAQRRVTDTYAAEQPGRRARPRAPTPTPPATPTCPGPGSRPWRSMLAAALDQVDVRGHLGRGGGRGVQPELRAAGDVAGGPAERCRSSASLSAGPRPHGRTAWSTACGPIVLDRADGSLATLSIQGQPDRAVALKRRETAELIAEELRRLDPDDTYASPCAAARTPTATPFATFVTLREK